MGAGYSTSQDQPPSRALHVLRVTPSSPASQTNIEPFFDFVVGFEGDDITAHKTINAADLEKIVESHEERVLNLLVWNNKNRGTRVVPIVPSRAWSSPRAGFPDPKESQIEGKPSLLGLSMRMCEPESSLDNVWHVMDVLEGSPAESAGLVPYGDWIIGWSGGTLSAENDFYDVVEAHVDKPLRVYVYSHDFDTIREVVLVPNRQWGGEGLLGCVFGFGLLHRIPSQPTDREPGSTPPELIQPDEEEYEEQTLFVPAEVPVPRAGTPDLHSSLDHTHHHHYTHGHDHHEDHSFGSDNSDVADHDEDQYHEGHHHEDHDHDHSHEHNSTHPHPDSRSISPTSTRTPFRTSSFTAERSSTPTPVRSLGSFVNGIGIARYSAHSSSPTLDRSGSSSTAAGGERSLELGGPDEHGENTSANHGNPNEMNIAESTDDETSSQGSLTSVD